jgi:cyclic beta-1,2-glucan synthetase
VISGLGPRERALAALDAAYERLVSEKDGLIRLLDPPFDRTPHDPGYIKGYVPGVRENGGQYTHAALWFVRALAEAGRADDAARLLAMLSPVSRAADPEAVQRYKVEPYVIAADVYGVAPHVGRGGWTWYTGSSGWMQRVAVETLLGLSLEDGVRLRVAPRVPADWPGFRVTWTRPGSNTRIVIEASPAAPGEAAGEAVFTLPDDGGEHRLEVRYAPGR